MTAIDTNVVVRYIVQDDPDQFARASELVRSTFCYVPDTVLLESVWVLQQVYKFAPSNIVANLSSFLGLATIRVRDPASITNALGWYADGLDFADSLHLATCQHLATLKTFDSRFIKRSRSKGRCSVTRL